MLRSPTESMRKREHPLSVPVAELTGLRRVAAVAARNVYWGRSHGWANLLEEHDLNLRVRVPRELRKFLWRRRSPSPRGTARPVFVVGVQRSGTNMLTHGLAMSPEFEVYNEGNRRAFANYRLRERDHIAALIGRSRHRYVLFKPLVDTHLIGELLDDLGTDTPPRAIWIYRDVRGRVRSELAKFWDSNLRIIRQRTLDPGLRHWQLNDDAGLSEASSALLNSFDSRELTPADGAALFWLMRNRLLFELGLHERDDVHVVSYDRLVAAPEETMRRVCRFLAFPYSSDLVKSIETRPQGPLPSTDIHPEILALCDDLSRRLDSLVR
jgi:Sulfotransferase domain